MSPRTCKDVLNHLLCEVAVAERVAGKAEQLARVTAIQLPQLVTAVVLWQSLHERCIARGHAPIYTHSGAARFAARTFPAVQSATIGESFQSFFDAVDQFFSNLASVRPGPLAARAGVLHGLPDASARAPASTSCARPIRTSASSSAQIWGAYFAGYGFNAVIPARGGDVVRLFLTKSSVPNSSYPAVAATLRRRARLRRRDGLADPAVRVHAGRVPQAARLRQAERLRPLLPRPAPALHPVPADGPGGRRAGRRSRC